MTAAKAELISRHVKGTNKNYDHLFVLFTFSNGAKQVIRGGAFNEKLGYEFVFIHSQNYASSIDNCKNKGHDCSSPYIFYEGSDDEIKKLHNLLLLKAEEINRSYYDYKLPDLRCEAKKLIVGEYKNTECHVQNSNTAIAQILKSANINFELPTRNGIEVNAIGYDQEFRHSPIDKVTGFLQMAINLNAMQGNDIKIDPTTEDKLRIAYSAYTKTLVETFDPIRQNQEKDLYPDNMPCCLEGIITNCKECDIIIHDDL